MPEFSFLLPPGGLSLEGGGAYIRNMIAALRSAGHAVQTGGEHGPATIRIIDGAVLPSISPEQTVGAIGLIHHPAALAAAEDHVAVRKAERERLALLRRIVTTSEAVKERLMAEFAVDAARISVVRPGVADVSRSTGSGDAGLCRVLSVGALVPRKGHGVLIAALAKLFDLPWRLVIAGDAERDPAHADMLHRLAAELGVAKQVRFAGKLDETELAAEWQQADVFALATEWEGFSSAVAEALRRGLPVAVTAGGSAAELVTPAAGVICTPGDAAGFSKSIRRLIFDTDLRREMADAAWQAGRALPDWQTQAAHFVKAAQCS